MENKQTDNIKIPIIFNICVLLIMLISIIRITRETRYLLESLQIFIPKMIANAIGFLILDILLFIFCIFILSRLKWALKIFLLLVFIALIFATQRLLGYILEGHFVKDILLGRAWITSVSFIAEILIIYQGIFDKRVREYCNK